MPLASYILDMIENISLKTQDIPSKLVSLNSIRLTLKVYHINMYGWLKNNLLFSKKLRLSCLSHMVHDILDVIDGISSETKDIPSMLVSFYVIRLTQQVGHKNMHVRLKNYILFAKKLPFTCPSPNISWI